ncbi:MAG: hypothetical protein ACOX4I_01045 [Anaerovoracaceae bacterium]|jgi:hypothetical protein
MKKNKMRALICALLCLMVAASLAGCGGSSGSATKKNEQKSEIPKVYEAVTGITAAVHREANKVPGKAPSAGSTGISGNTSSAAGSGVSDDNAGSSGGSTDISPGKAGEAGGSSGSSGGKPAGHVLTIIKGSKVQYYTASRLKSLGTVSCTYSFRNKESSQRQTGTWTGVRLKTLIKDSGFSGSTIRIKAADGYTRDYSLSDLYSGKWAYRKKTGQTHDVVPAIISTSGDDCYRLCFGQNPGDSDSAGDYNQQYWAKWIDSITVN